MMEEILLANQSGGIFPGGFAKGLEPRQLNSCGDYGGRCCGWFWATMKLWFGPLPKLGLNGPGGKDLGRRSRQF